MYTQTKRRRRVNH